MKKFIYILALALILNSAFLIQNCFSQWQPDVRLTNNPASSYTSCNNAWCIAVNGNIVHTVWHDDRDYNGEIYYKRSTDGGTTWGADTRLTNNSAESFHPSIAISGSLVHIVWNDERDGNSEIYYKRSTDGGITWGEDTRLTNNSAWSLYPSLAVFGFNVQAAWFDDRDGNYEIYYKSSTDGGITWGADTRLTNNNGSSVYPSIAVSGPYVHTVWYDNRNGNNEIYYKHSTDGGTTWGADTRLTNNVGNSWYPSIAVTGTNVNVVWYDNRDPLYKIYYKRSTDSGINWGADIRLSDTNSLSERPSIANSGLLVHIVWYDSRDGNSEIYYKCSTNGGTNWGMDTRLTNNTAFSRHPSIAVSGTNVHIVWHDGRDSNDEIYNKRNPTGNVGIQNISTETPSKYSLSQNYPNPFNSTSNLKFEIAKLEHVRITVYDIMGKEVQTLVNEKLQPGTYSTQWDASNYTSGVYFYKMQTESFTETKRMLMIK